MGRLDHAESGGRYIVAGQVVDAKGEALEPAPGQPEQEGGFDVESATIEQLKAEAEKRGIEVKRSEGEGAPLKADYQAALRDAE